MAKTSPLRKTVEKEQRQTSNAERQNVIEQVRGLAWTGQHAKAIELTTQALKSPSSSRTRRFEAEQMDLLDLRAESYIASGKLDLASKDANAMMKLAKGLDTPRKERGATRPTALLAQALNRRALVQMRTGDLKAAVKASAYGGRVGGGVSVLKERHSTAAVSRPRLHALALFRLSEAQWRTRQNEAALETAQKAIALYQELGDDSGAGRAHWSLAVAFFQLNRAEDSRRTAQTALALCQKAGDQYGIGNAFNALTFTDTDLAERIQHTQQALY